MLQSPAFRPEEASDPAPGARDLLADRETRRAIIVVTFAFWVSNHAVLTLRAAIDGYPELATLAVARAGLAMVGIALCYLIHRVMQRFGPRPFGQRIGVITVLAVVAADLYGWATVFAFTAIKAKTLRPASAGEAIFNMAFLFWFFLAWAAVYMALVYSLEVKAQQQRWAALQALAHGAQLRALHYQVNPHFLFNTLNSISSLILDDRNRQADAMVGKLSELYRASLATDPLEDIALEDEIALQRTYLEIEQVRFPDLDIAIELPDELRRARVPTLILQPLIENSIKYAVSGSATAALIEIRASRQADRLRIEVLDDGGASCAPAGLGLGLRNVRERLEHRFGADCRFEAAPKQPSGFCVLIELPLLIA